MKVWGLRGKRRWRWRWFWQRRRRRRRRRVWRRSDKIWFKRDGRDQVEVSVAPGGRWSRFKTYSTIQRTLESWGFFLTFVFKSWLNNQKFSYPGGMTEEKKTGKRKALAKWLKESILPKNMLISSQNFRIKFLLFQRRQLYL